jgi:hypothetical protein
MQNLVGQLNSRFPDGQGLEAKTSQGACGEFELKKLDLCGLF